MSNTSVHIDKIFLCIESCQTVEQLKSCNNMIQNFEVKHPDHKYVVNSLIRRWSKKYSMLQPVK